MTQQIVSSYNLLSKLERGVQLPYRQLLRADRNNWLFATA